MTQSGNEQRNEDHEPSIAGKQEGAVQTPEPINAATPSKEQNDNREKQKPNLTLASIQEQDNVQTTPDRQLILNRVQVDFPRGPN